MPDQFGGIEVDESPSTPPTLPEVQRDQFGGISVDDEALRFATTVPQQITGRLARGIELGALAQPEPPQPRRAVVTRAGVREVPPGVPLPGERPLSTDLERLAQSIPQGQNIVTRPLSSLARTGLSFASAATAPENVPATVALASPLAPVAEAYFGYQMGKGAVESAKQIYDLMRQPGPVDEAFKQKLSDAIVNAEALGVGATGIGADLLRKAKNKVADVVRPATQEIRPAPVAPEAAPVAPAPAPTPLTAAEQAAERARLASELGEEPVAPTPAPAPEPAPVPEAPVKATAPAKPEVAKLGDPSTKPNRFGDPAATTYYATPEDWQAWQEHDARFKKISKDFIEAMRGGDPEKIAEAQKAQLEVGKEHEVFREKYGGMNPEPPKSPAAEPETAAPTYTGPDAIEIVGKPLGDWFKAKTAADLPKGVQRVELAGRIRAKSTKPKDILSALKGEQDRIRRVVTEMAKPPLSPEEAIPMVQPTPVTPTATETTPPVPAVPTKAAKPVVLTPKGKVPPNSAIIEVVDYNGRMHAKVVLPHDGTPEGAIEAAKKLRAYADQNFEWKTELYHTNTRYGATDASGNLKWVISPNAANIAEVGTPQARYILGDLSAAPSKVGTTPPVLSEPTAPPTETPPQATEKPVWQMTEDEFVAAGAKGKVHKVTGKPTPGEPIKADTPISIGEREGYSPQDIARFYLERRGMFRGKLADKDILDAGRTAYQEMLEDAKRGGKGPGPIGMGAAVSEEFEHDPRTPTGIRNAIVDKERAKRGLPKAMKAARRSFGEVWDRAMALIDRDPTTQDELLNTLRDKPRALTDTEDALVLHRQIDLQNEYGKATRDLAQAFDDGRLDDVARERVRVASLADKLLDIYNIGKTSGTETARGLSARRMMANEDFTLARMVTEKRAANQGKPLTDAQNAEIERLNKIIERTQKALDDFQKSEAERRGGGPPPTTPPRIDPELERIKADNERAKREYRESLIRDRLRQRTPFEKTQDWIVKWRRAFVLSSPITLAKLTSAAVQRMTFTPIEELLGAGISKAIPSVAQRAAREGGINARAEAKALTEGFTKGMRDSWDVLRTGRSSLDVLYGRAAGYPPGVSDFFGHVHGALKSVTKRNEFARAFEKRSAAAIAQGVDVSDPFVQSSIAVESYKDANRSIFQQDNRVITAYKAALRVLEQRAKDTGKTPAGAKAIATTGKILLPIVRIPTNIVAETLQYATGSVTGSARLARAFAKGIENLQPAEADIIMRNLKKGSIGAAVLALGYLNADVIGGYYEPGKRKPQDVPFGRVRVYGHDIPSYLLHNPLLETLQVGATARRLAESKLSKKDAEAQGIGWGIVGAGMGLLEEVPFLRETVELAKTFRAGERRQFLGELLKSLTVPQGVQWLAASQDVDQYGRPISRKPRTLAESVKTGIPGLREEVPVRPPPKRTP